MVPVTRSACTARSPVAVSAVVEILRHLTASNGFGPVRSVSRVLMMPQ